MNYFFYLLLFRFYFVGVDSNLLSVHVDSAFSVPDSWQIQVAQQFNHTVSLPIPISAEVRILQLEGCKVKSINLNYRIVRAAGISVLYARFMRVNPPCRAQFTSKSRALYAREKK